MKITLDETNTVAHAGCRRSLRLYRSEACKLLFLPGSDRDEKRWSVIRVVSFKNRYDVDPHMTCPF